MISVNWVSKVISIPQADLTFVSGSLYELDVNTFRLALKNLEDDEAGMPYPITHNHNAPVTVGGVTLARVVEIRSPYTVTFEDVGTPYSVRAVGANHNLGDVKNVNQVSLIVGNSGGLIQIASGSGLSSEESTMLGELYKLMGLVIGSPLTVSATQRSAAGIVQQISENGGVVTVARQ